MADFRGASQVGYSRILGPSASIALGLSISFGLGLLVGVEMVLGLDPDAVQTALVVSVVLFLPVLLTYAEMAAGRSGSASAYQISRGYGYPTFSFATGWLMLAGLAAAATILCRELALRLDYSVNSIFGVDFDHLWFVVLGVALAGLNEWLSSGDRWRFRTFLVWLGTVMFIGILAWAIVEHPVGEGEIPALSIRGHNLQTVALLAVGLWFADVLLNYRRLMRRPDSTLRRSMVAVWLLTISLSMITAYIVTRSPSLLVEFWAAQVSWGKLRVELLILAVGILFAWLGLSRLVSRTVRLTGAMARDGFLPMYHTGSNRRLRALISMLILGTAVVLSARYVRSAQLVAVAAASFLVVTVLVTFPHARRSARELAPHRRNRLPLHPLFPALTIVVSAFLTAVLPRIGLAILLVWAVVGLIFYLGFARRRARAVLQEEAVVGEVEEIRKKESPRILVGAGDREQLDSLLALGRAIARGQRAELIVIRVLPTADELSLYAVQRSAENQWDELNHIVGRFESKAVPITSLVRIAPTVEAGILAAASEYDVDLLLLGAEDLPREAPPSALLSGIFSSTSRPLSIVRGRVVEERLDVVVGTGGGPHAPLALQLGAAIADNTGGTLELIAVVPKAQSDEPAQEALRLTIEKADLGREVEARVVEAQSVESGLIEVARGKLLILGSAVDRLLKRTVYEGLPMELGRVHEGATLTVKRAEAAMLFWQRRLWELLARYTPTLTIAERSQVYSQMRHSAKADVDFYALISLSSAIAILGLLLDSGAVIIGAMLVAPLMSPILAIAQGIVQGNPMMIQRAGASTFKGMTISIGVATVITSVLPTILPNSEILARTTPNLLDLGVALAAGAAAVWAVSRSSVAAALPGVAIAVALVPPLCVVGYGLGTSRFWISGGAFLLFLTNLAAIVLTGALVFVLLGFRPTRVGREAQVRKAAVVAIVAVAILIIPLGLSTVQMSRQTGIESELREVLRAREEQSFRVQDLKVSREGRGFLVQGTVFAFEGFETERVFEFQEELRRVAGVPVRLEINVVPATLTVAGDKPETKADGPVLPSGGD